MKQIASRKAVLSARIASDPHHGRTQQAILVLITALQFFEHVMIRYFGRVHHFDRFVNPRIERLPQGNNRLHSSLLQRILKLPIDKLNPVAEVGSIAASF